MRQVFVYSENYAKEYVMSGVNPRKYEDQEGSISYNPYFQVVEHFGKLGE
jgi:hypothetical protein